MNEDFHLQKESWYCTLEHYSLGLWPLFKYNKLFITRSSHLRLSQLQQSWIEPQEPELHPHSQVDFLKSRKSLHSLEDTLPSTGLFHSTQSLEEDLEDFKIMSIKFSIHCKIVLNWLQAIDWINLRCCHKCNSHNSCATNIHISTPLSTECLLDQD